MLLNYHELTMEESSRSPARRMQFKIICTIMAVAVVYSVVSSGALRPVEVHEGTFPGGDFVYRYTGRDYAASMSLLGAVAEDLGARERDYGGTMYNLYLDDPLAVNGRGQRFASGVLLNDQTATKKHATNEKRKSALVNLNQHIQDPTREEVRELPAHELWRRLKYRSQELPAVRAAVTKFAFNNGFVSALVHSYKVCSNPDK